MPNPFKIMRISLVILIAAPLLFLAACADLANTYGTNLSASEYRQQAYRAVDDNRYKEGAKLLQKAINMEPRSEDLLLLGDLREGLEQYRAARSAYQKGLDAKPSTELTQALVYHWATLEALEFDNQEKALELSTKLSEDSPAYINLRALQAIKKKQFDAALKLATQVTSDYDDQEMKGWAHYHSAQAWVAVGNESNAFQALFFAINHARGHGLVGRITRLWEELKQQPLPQ